METRCYGLSRSYNHTTMNSIDIEITNYKEISDRFIKRSKNMKDTIQRIVSRVALTVERFGKLYSPVRTGRMRASIIPINISNMAATVGPQVDYAPYVHRRIPFMFAAKIDTEKQVDSIVKSEVRKAIE